MSFPRLWFAWLALLAIGRAAEPETEVRDAISGLLNASGYRWRRWDIQPTAAEHTELTKKGVWGSGPFPPLVWAGIANRAGLCIWQTEIDQRRVTGVVDGPRRALDYGSGWQTWPEFKAAVEAVEMQRAVARQRVAPPEDSWHAKALAARDSFIIPADHLRLTFEGTVLYQRDGEVIRSVFTEPGAHAIIVPESGWNHYPNTGGTTRQTQGTATWWLKDGQLTKVEFHVEGYFAPNPPGFGEMYIYRTIVLVFTDVGAAELQLSSDARAALDRDTPAPTARRKR